MESQGQTRRELLLAGAAGLAASVTGAMAAEKNAGADKKPAAEKKPPVVLPASPFEKVSGPAPAALKVSLCAYSFRQWLDTPGKPGKISLFDLIDYCAHLNLDGIEMTSYYFLKDDDAYVNELKRKAYLAGLGISGMPIANNFVFPAGPQRDAELAKVDKWLPIASRLGVTAIRVFAGSPIKGIEREAATNHVIECLKIASERAAKHGVILALEDHHYLVEGADELLHIVNAVNSEWVGINLDTGNFEKGDPYEQIAKAAPKAVTCQFKIQVKNAAGQREPADFMRIGKIMRDAHYRGYIALEYEGPDAPKEVPMYLQKMKEAAAG
jgi:sugar phosphate isomerase/epimerase